MDKHSRTGQAVLEFAVFASFLLLCLGILIQNGMATLLFENLRMTSFRKSNALAKMVGATTYSANPQVSITVIKDQFIPTPGRHFGAADTAALPVNYNPVISTKLSLSPSPTAIANQQLLPQMWLDINGTVRQYNLARYWQVNVADDQAFRVKEDDTSNPGGTWWKWVNGGNCTLSTRDSSGELYIKTGNQVWVDSDGVDSDGDGELEYETPLSIIDMWTNTYNCGYDEYGNPISCSTDTTIVFLNPAQGDINPYAESFNPATGLTQGQGLQPAFSKERASTNTVTRTETPGSVRTQGSINNQVTIKRTVAGTGGPSAFDTTVTQTIQENF
jgi:hypothetical protein